MQESEPAPICGKRQPKAIVKLALLICLVLFGLVGCEKEKKVADHVPERRAEVQGVYLGGIVARNAQSMVMMHPSSDRQRHAREQMLHLDEMLRESESDEESGAQ